jgi:hypothetical protein
MEGSMVRRGLIIIVLMAPVRAGADNPNPSFYLVNHASRQINEVYASPVDAQNWGRDRLGDDVIGPGNYAAIRLVADGKCVYDLRVVYDGGRSEERRGVDVCAVDDIVFSGGSPGGAPNAARDPTDPSFRLTNRGRHDLVELYARPAGRRDWGADRLGDDTVDAGASTDITLPNGQCLWDLRLVFEDQPAIEKRRVDLCRTHDLRVP